MTQTIKPVELGDLLPTASLKVGSAKALGNYKDCEIETVPARAFTMRDYNPQGALLETATIHWTPGALTLSSKLGKFLFLGAALDTIEASLGWLARNKDPKYLADHTSARKTHQGHAAREFLLNKLLDDFQTNLRANKMVGPDGRIPDPLPAGFVWDGDSPWRVLHEYFDQPFDKLNLESGRQDLLRIMLERVDFDSPGEVWTIHGTLFGYEDITLACQDYSIGVYRAMLTGQVFAEAILASPEFATKEVDSTHPVSDASADAPQIAP